MKPRLLLALRTLLLIILLTSAGYTEIVKPLIFNEEGYGYSIEYPGSWTYEKPKPNIVLFSGKEGTDAYYSTVNIQNLKSSKIEGGHYTSIEDVVKDLKAQFTSQGSNGTIYGEKNFFSTLNNIQGLEFTTDYNRYKDHFKQWVVVVPTPNKDYFFLWSYTAPVDKYDTFLPVAKDMLHSWLIY